MNCFSCRAKLDDFLDASLSASQREEVAAHLTTCAECSAYLAELESDRRLARVALADLVAVPAPLELRLRVRAALQDERAAQIARPAWWQKLELSSKSRPAVWSGTLVFATLALLILARPFAQQPLSLPDSVSSESVAKESAPADSESDAPAVAPPTATRKTARSTDGAAKKLGQTALKVAPGEAKTAPPKSVSKTAPPPDDSRAKPSMPAREIASPSVSSPSVSPLAAPLPPIPIPAAPLPKRAANSATSPLRMPALPASGAARPDSAPPTTNRTQAELGSADSSLQDAPKSAKPAQNRAARVVTRSAAPSAKSAITNDQMKQLQAAGSALSDDNPLFTAKISPAEPNQALSESGNRNQNASMRNRAAPGSKVAAQAPMVRQMPSPQTRNAAPPVPDSQEFAPQMPAGGGGFSGGAGGFGGGRGGAPNRDTADAAAQSNLPVLAAPKSANEAGETRQWTLEISAPREVSGAQIRVILPPTLRFAAGDGAASRVVWSGDLVTRRAVKIEFALSGARGGEKISVVVEQNRAAGESKKVETLDVTLPTPR